MGCEEVVSAVVSFSQCKGTKKKAKDNGVYRMTEGGVQDDGRRGKRALDFFPREEKKISSPRKGMEGRQEPGECHGWL